MTKESIMAKKSPLTHKEIRELHKQLMQNESPAIALIKSNQPIAIGEGKVLLVSITEILGCSKPTARSILQHHTSRLTYLTNLVNNTHRLNVNLEAVSEIAPEHKETANQKLQKALQRTAAYKERLAQAEKNHLETTSGDA
jgi:sRNA-binding protein